MFTCLFCSKEMVMDTKVDPGWKETYYTCKHDDFTHSMITYGNSIDSVSWSKLNFSQQFWLDLESSAEKEFSYYSNTNYLKLELCSLEDFAEQVNRYLKLLPFL